MIHRERWQKGAALAGETILIIDDNVDVCSLLGERVLPIYGYRTLTAADGREGLWQIRTQKPDLVLLDLRLPDMTGLELLHTLSSEGYDTPVILITAYGSELIAAQALRMGVRDYIIKPFTLDEVVESVERALMEQRLRRERNVLTDDLNDCVNALRMLAEAGTQSGSVEDPNLRLCHLLDTAVAVTNSRSGRVWVHEPDKGSTILWATRERTDPQAYLLQRQEDPSPQIGRALTSGEPQQWSTGESKELQRNWLAVPILLAGRPAGALEICFGGETGLWNDIGLLMLRILADWIAMVMERAHLRQQAAAAQG